MELALNLGWVAMALVMCWLWLLHAPMERRGRSAQAVSLTLVLVTMFTVITMYDDMAMAQNPAEMRCFQREDDLGGHANAPFHPVVAMAPAVAAEPRFNTLRPAVVGKLLARPVESTFLSSIQNRPPPAA